MTDEKLIEAAADVIDFAFSGNTTSVVPLASWNLMWRLKDELDVIRAEKEPS